ncbi:hypothetical protein [Streptomyces sp. NPDC097981]|uniref:hypothetical protein n=1 Tax=Streptomyces sp. NPDC097981 TaxID=3155428 RepID=UPI003318F9AB
MSEPLNPFAPSPPQQPRAVPPQETNGQAVLALVLGALGALVAGERLLFWVGFPLGLAALVFGLVACSRAFRGAPHKALAAVGTAVGILALGLSLYGLASTLRSLTEWEGGGGGGLSASTPIPLVPVPESSAPLPGAAGAMPFGTTYTYDSGVEVTVRDLAAYQPVREGPVADGPLRAGVRLKVTVVNRSDEPLDLGKAIPTATDHRTAGHLWGIHDRELPRPFEGTLRPGDTATAEFGFLPAAGAEALTFEISPGLTPYDARTWTTPLR